MGCGGGKEEGAKKKDGIDYEMSTTHVPDLDDFCGKASTILEAMEHVRAGLGDTVEGIYELVDADWLPELKLLEAIKIFIWSVSANKEGKISNARPQILSEAPYITLDASECRVQVYEINQNLTEYIKALVEGPGKLIEAGKALEELVEQGKTLNVKESIQNANCSPMDKLKAAGKYAGNMNKVKNGLTRLKEVMEILNKAVADLKELIPQLKEVVKDADKIGKEAFDAGHLLPQEIMEFHYTGPKRTKEEYKKVKKEKEEKDKKKNKKKDKKKKDKKDKKGKEGKEEEGKEEKEEKKEKKKDKKKEHKDNEEEKEDSDSNKSDKKDKKKNKEGNDDNKKEKKHS